MSLFSWFCPNCNLDSCLLEYAWCAILALKIRLLLRRGPFIQIPLIVIYPVSKLR